MNSSVFFQICVITFFLSFIPHAHALTDIQGKPEEAAIRRLVDQGIIRGYSDNTFKPSKTINRAELLKIAIEATTTAEERKWCDYTTYSFDDVPEGAWYESYVCIANQKKIIQGYTYDPNYKYSSTFAGGEYSGTVRPHQLVNLAEALKILFRTFEIKLLPGKSSAWYAAYIATAKHENILTHLLSNPAHILTRAEAASAIDALLSKKNVTTTNTASFTCGNGVKEAKEQCDDGNALNGDGCSAICVVVPEPVRLSQLKITGEAAGVIRDFTRGQANVPLLKFAAQSDRQEAVIDALRFTAVTGSLHYMQNFTLKIDADRDGQYEKTIAKNGKVSGGILVFDYLQEASARRGIQIPIGEPVHFLVQGDISPNTSVVTLGLGFAVNEPDYIEAHGNIDGIALEGIETNHQCDRNCFISVNTFAPQDINIQNKGNLFITEDSQPVQNHIIVGGTISEPLLRLRLTAEQERLDIRLLKIDGVSESVDSLLVYRLNVGESISPNQRPVATLSTSQCGTTDPTTRRCGVLPYSTILVSPEQPTILVFAASMKNEALGGKSGENFALSLSAATDPVLHAIEAVGTSSLVSLLQNNGDGVRDGEIFIGASSPQSNIAIIGKTHDTALSSLASLVHAGPSDGGLIPAGITNLSSFTLRAGANNNNLHGSHDVILHTMGFSVGVQNATIDPTSFTLATSDNPQLTLGCSATVLTTGFNVLCSGIEHSTIQSVIPQGQDVTYRLSASITNPAPLNSGGWITTSLPILSNRSAINSITWSDEETIFSWVDVKETSIKGTTYRR